MLSVDKLIADQSASNPSKIAIKHGKTSLTYKQLNETSNQFARFLKDEGINNGDVIGVAIDRSPEMVITLLAIVKTGATYLPIDNSFPVDRINYMLDDASVKLLITSQRFKEHYPDKNILFIEDACKAYINCDSGNLSPDINEDSLAYILYTSGSTGRPKGVEVKHTGLTNFLLSMQQSPGIGPDDIMLNTTTVSFDIAELEIYLPLISGAQLVIANAEIVRDGRALLDIIGAEKITVMQGTPFMWRTMLEAEWDEVLPLKILCGGEALPKELAEKLLARCISLWNMYGPTETTIWSLIKKLSANDEIITIGKPIDNTQVYILDENLNKVADGETGEIYIGGDGVAKGYINKPDLTAERFIADKFLPGKNNRMYKTGDLGRFLDNGEIQCMGRIDHQIKIRGYRIETEEIEHQLKQLNNIKDALIILHSDTFGNGHLIAYITMVNSVSGDNGDITKSWKLALRAKLPEYMIPNVYMVIDHIPLMANGKIDRKALPEPVINQNNQNQYEAPQNGIESILVKFCLKSIAIEKIGVTDNLFNIGINSLMAVGIMVQIEKQFGKRLPLSTLLKNPTIRQLALVINNDPEDIIYKSLIPIKPEGGKMPLYIVHGIGLNLMNLNKMISYLDPEQPVYGLQSIGLDGSMQPPDTIEAIAAVYNDEIIKHDPEGPYAIAGYSAGGVIAFEMVRQLNEMGKDVTLLAMFDTNRQYSTNQYPFFKKYSIKLKRKIKKALFTTTVLFTHPTDTIKYSVKYYTIRFNFFLKRIGVLKNYHPLNLPDFMEEIVVKLESALNNYEVKPGNVKITLFKAELRTFFVDDPEFLGWGKYALQGVEVYDVPGDHDDMFETVNAEVLAKKLQNKLNQLN